MGIIGSGPADNKYLKTVISEGRAETQMTAWKAAAAGLSDKDVDDIIGYLTKDRSAEKPEPFGFAKFGQGDAAYGEDMYKTRCMNCHGTKGEGGVWINLRNPVVQKLADPEFLAITLRDGRQGTHMAKTGWDSEIRISWM